MLIIVEGMDNTGKTTLANRLADDLKLVLVSNKKRPESFQDIKEYCTKICELAENRHVITDRWAPISEKIYGPICRDSHIYKDENEEEFETQVHTFIIYCRPTIKTIKEFGNRSQMEGVIEKADELIKAYDNIPFFLVDYMYNYKLSDYIELMGVIRESINKSR